MKLKKKRITQTDHLFRCLPITCVPNIRLLSRQVNNRRNRLFQRKVCRVKSTIPHCSYSYVQTFQRLHQVVRNLDTKITVNCVTVMFPILQVITGFLPLWPVIIQTRWEKKKRNDTTTNSRKKIHDPNLEPVIVLETVYGVKKLWTWKCSWLVVKWK